MTGSYFGPFGLKEAPFTKEIADTDLWLPTSKAAVVDELCEALSERASVLLTGDPGVGKTCVLRALRKRLPEAGYRLTYCHNATLGRRDFYRQLSLPLFLIDEAHLLHPEMLGHLHILLNYEWDSKALLSLILVGLPELSAQLKMRRFRSLHSRLHWRLHIDPLTPEDTAEYLRYRMKRAGCERDVFTQDAVQMLHEAATDGMRDLDRLATGCLREAARKKRKLIERDLLPCVLDRDGLERTG